MAKTDKTTGTAGARESDPLALAVDPVLEPNLPPAEPVSEESTSRKITYEEVAPTKTVGTYEERPYGDAVTPEHRKFLEASGVRVAKPESTKQ